MRSDKKLHAERKCWHDVKGTLPKRITDNEVIKVCFVLSANPCFGSTRVRGCKSWFFPDIVLTALKGAGLAETDVTIFTTRMGSDNFIFKDGVLKEYP